MPFSYHFQTFALRSVGKENDDGTITARSERICKNYTHSCAHTHTQTYIFSYYYWLGGSAGCQCFVSPKNLFPQFPIIFPWGRRFTSHSVTIFVCCCVANVSTARCSLPGLIPFYYPKTVPLERLSGFNGAVSFTLGADADDFNSIVVTMRALGKLSAA